MNVWRNSPRCVCCDPDYRDFLCLLPLLSLCLFSHHPTLSLSITDKFPPLCIPEDHDEEREWEGTEIKERLMKEEVLTITIQIFESSLLPVVNYFTIDAEM